VTELTPEQKAEVERLVANGFSEKAAVEVATEIQLDQPVKHGGSSLVEPLRALLDE
jgi:hypothetical protein